MDGIFLQEILTFSKGISDLLSKYSALQNGSYSEIVMSEDKKDAEKKVTINYIYIIFTTSVCY